jgi:hypothetical protein
MGSVVETGPRMVPPSGGETGPRKIPIPWDPSFYVIQGEETAGDMLKSEYATNAEYGVVDKALSAFFVKWEGITDPPAGFPPLAHAPTHLPGGTDPIGLASSIQLGFMAQGDGSPNSYYGGDNAVHPLSDVVTEWFTGVGPPDTIPGSKPGDFYLDTSTGDLYELS